MVDASNRYTDSDYDYAAVSLRPTIPRPTRQTCPPVGRGRGRRGRNHSHYRGGNNRVDYHNHQYQYQQEQHHANPLRHTPPPPRLHAAGLAVTRLSCKTPLEAGRNVRGLIVVVGQYTEPNYRQFCESGVVRRLLERKDALSGMSRESLTAARSKANPYERVGHSIFINRAAIKLACLDAMFHVSGIKDDELAESGLLRFADICAGPGGFAEYLLWRRLTAGDQVTGWGMTLRGGDMDFQIDRFHQDTVAHDTFSASYGKDGTGNIYVQENIDEFARVVMEGTRRFGVDLVTADGGLNVQGHEQMQERYTKQLILCQVLTMFSILRKRGDFVLKVFDIWLPFTAGIVWILYRYFDTIAIVKPPPSRPANSERYIVCQGLRERRPPVMAFLVSVNKKMNELRHEKSSEEVVEIVDYDEMKRDSEFITNLRQSNIGIATKQIQAIEDLFQYYREPTRARPFDQDEVRKACYNEWKLPLEFREDNLSNYSSPS